MMRLAPATLANAHVRLEPIAEAHREGLRTVADDPEIWRWKPFDGGGEHHDRWFDYVRGRHDAGDWVYFAVRALPEERLIGATGFCLVDAYHHTAEIGATWYAKDVWGTPVNPSCKLLMLGHAFTSGATRVEFKTDARNARSRAAIAKLGAVEEGTLRKRHVVRDGFARDTVYFSILAEEWPDVRARLEARAGGSA